MKGKKGLKIQQDAAIAAFMAKCKDGLVYGVNHDLGACYAGVLKRRRKHLDRYNDMALMLLSPSMEGDKLAVMHLELNTFEIKELAFVLNSLLFFSHVNQDNKNKKRKG